MRSVALMNQKGGVGKTTTTVNLAAGLAAAGQRVLLIDLDPQAHATLHLGVDPAQLDASVYDLLLDAEHDPASAVRQVRDGLWLLPAETDLAAAENELGSDRDHQHRLRRALEKVSDRFDIVLFDCPPALGLLTLSALIAADEVLIPMQAHFLALQGVSKLLETVKLVRSSLNPSLRVAGVVLCMHENQTTLAQEVVADIEGFFEQAKGTGLPWEDARILKPAIRRNIKLAECPSFGQTIFEYAPSAAGAEDYAALARDVLSRNSEQASPGADDATEPPEVVIVPRHTVAQPDSDHPIASQQSHSGQAANDSNPPGPSA